MLELVDVRLVGGMGELEPRERSSEMRKFREFVAE